MQKLLKNPYLIGCGAGLVATIVHYINLKIIKKKEEIDYNELAKVFITISLLAGGGMFLYQKKGTALLKGGGSSVSTSNSSVPVPQAPVNNTSVPSTNVSVETLKPNNLEISDINTGMPGF